MTRTATLTTKRLRSLLDYDAATGILSWRFGRRAGRPAGCRHSSGRIFIKIDRVVHMAHRLAWQHATGERPNHDIDHRNLRMDDNRLVNLRACDDSLNQANTLKRPTNTSGYKGVCWNKVSGIWQAGIKRHGRSTHLGLYDCPVAAHLAYAVAAERIYGQFARSA